MAIPNRGPELLAVNVAFMSAAILGCGLRCFVRIRMVKAFGVDDYLMVTATLFFIMYTASSIIGIQYGTGRHYRDLSDENIAKARHAWWFCYLFYSISMVCSKLSIGCLLLRISIRRIHTWIIYAAMFTSIVAGGTFFFVCIFQCHPVSYMWNKITQSGTCVDNTVITALSYTYSIFSILSDFTFAIIPGFLVWHLQLKRRAKIALIPLITMGCIASAAVIARLPFIRHFNSPDFLWSTLDIAIWSTVEQGLAITAGSLATLRPLFFIAMNILGLTTRVTNNRPSNGGMSAPLPANAAPGSSKADKQRTDMYKLSANVQTRGSDDESLSRTGDFPKSSNWFDTAYPTPAPRDQKKSAHDNDNESERSLRIKDSRNSGDEAMGIMVSKSFYITDEERRSIISRGEPCR